MSIRRAILLLLPGVFAGRPAMAAELSARAAAPAVAPEPVRVAPLLDEPLRDASICRGPDGTFYLTGTAASRRADGTLDFCNNQGIRLWKSTDLRSWQEVGLVWDLQAQEPQGRSLPRPRDRRYFDVVAGVIDSPLVYGVTAPEIHWLKGTFWITYSMNGQQAGLLKSVSGAGEGPYEDVGLITRRGADASLFEDDDGTVYWVFGEGWIARMNAEMTALAEPPRLLQPAPNIGDLPNSPLTVGRSGAFMFKARGKYHLVAADVWGRLGNGCYDTFVAQADTLMGRYGPRRLMVPHGGQVTVFDDGQRNYFSTFSGVDRKAALRDRPAIVPLEWVQSVLYGTKPTAPFPRKPAHIVTERGPWAQLRPAVDVNMRDVQVLNAPDGYYYLTGSVVDPRYSGKLGLWRSRDLKAWERLEVQ